ncbi:glycosyltransferase [Primorskyibacter flagellatus]|uniref:Glycosyltransferase, GT2 family n=1 Tax=Primorskyibacter flagellatus TaxID=1387277 RepID=A0A1W2EP03_9RHOB|nr:glycosyltransferase [Primorskyibacter flagellatus]SMD11411.1 Glycosyltransferase, GT2 family [Primorskyibacter flagellatus]
MTHSESAKTAAGLVEVSVIIVNYGTDMLAIESINSVLAQKHDGRNVDVHVLDNASPGDDAARLRATFGGSDYAGRVTLYTETENHGFGRGNNIVLRALAEGERTPEYVFLLNPDARLENDAITILAGFLDSHPGAAAAGAGICLPGGAPVTAAFRFPSAMGEFARAANVGIIDRALKHWRIPLPPDLPRGPVDWVAGAAVMFRYDVLAEMNGFDEDFFLYYEEVELMHRIHQVGHDIWYVPEARVSHVEGAATRMRSGDTHRTVRPRYWYESWRHYYLKTHGRVGTLVAASACISGAAINNFISLLRRQIPRTPRHFSRDFGRFVLRPLVSVRKQVE